jgi:hypothetical protein
MICLEMGPVYNMNGCVHTICTLCADQMRGMESSIVYPLSNVFTLKEQGVVCLRCPYCRTRESFNFTECVNSIRYRESYNLWMELELRCDGEKSTVCLNYNNYYRGKNRPFTIEWTVYVSFPLVSKYDFWMGTSYKHRKHLVGCSPLKTQKHITNRTKRSFKQIGNFHGR